MKVLEICEAYGGGVKRQVDYLNRFGHMKNLQMITLVSSKRGAEIPAKYLVDDRMSDFPKKIFKFFSILKCLHKLITSKKIQLVHAHSTVAGITMVLYKIRYHDCPPVFFTPHAYFSEINRGSFKNLLLKLAEKFMSHFFTKVIHVSSDEENYALTNKLVKRDQSLVINNGVPFHQIHRTQHSAVSFVNVARCDFQKNPQLFIDIAQKIIKERPNSNFIWVGDGPLLNECRTKIINLGLSSKIKFVGYRNDPYKYLEDADIFFSTSRYEGQPFSVLEAISEKMPLIITDVIGHTELVKENGILLTEAILNDDSQLLKAFDSVIVAQRQFSDASYQLFTKHYNVIDMVNKIERLYLSGVVA